MKTKKQIIKRIETQRVSAHTIPEYPDEGYNEFEKKVFWDGFILALRWVIE